MHDMLPDLTDLYPNQLEIAEQLFRDYGWQKIFSGEIVTVSCLNDNSKVKELAATPGHGKVMVVDGQGSLSRALLGDMIAQLAVENGWEGFVINGCIRDAGEMSTLPIAVKALNTHPVKTEKLGQGETNVPVSFAGLTFIPGHYIYGDLNGLAISQDRLELT